MADPMTMSLSLAWQSAGLAFHLVGAVAAIAVAIMLARGPRRFGSADPAIVGALVLNAIWSLTVAAIGDTSFAAMLMEAMRNLAWLIVIYRLFVSDGRHTSLAPIRPVVFALVFVELVSLGMTFVIAGLGGDARAGHVVFDFATILRLLFAVGVLVLVHNLYVGASLQSRAALRWPAAGLACLWTFDLNLYTMTYLAEGWPVEVAAARGLAVLALIGLLAIGASKGRATVRLMPSRAVTFQTFSLLVIGAYFVSMVAVAQWLSYAGGDFARLMELGFLTVASAVAVLVLPSKRMRGWFRVTVAKHLFQHRYDYREEWLRFTRTIGNNGGEALPLGERVIQAVADIAEARAGLLLIRGEDGNLTLSATWNWREAEVPSEALSAEAIALFERDSFIADIDDVRAGIGAGTQTPVVPDWLKATQRAWAMVPLIHYERLVGMVVLARPSLPRKLDWEDFDLLRVVGQQLASYLAENASQEALAEASRFDDFHRRIAFVMHDIKNLASQLSLLARNAERHAEKKEFRDDMLVTLRNSSDKLNALIARLSRYGTGGVERMDAISGADVVRSVVGRYARLGDGNAQVVLAVCQPVEVMANSNSLEQVLVHLVQNAVDASPAHKPVCVSLTEKGGYAQFEVVDSGCGMSPEFVRTQLFKPFVSTKSGGFGIGAFEARELVEAMRGSLDVESREGIGSRFAVRIPLSSAVGIQQDIAGNEDRMAS